MYQNVYFNISLTADFKTNLLQFILTSCVTCVGKQDLPALTFPTQKPVATISNFLASTQFISKIK